MRVADTTPSVGASIKVRRIMRPGAFAAMVAITALLVSACIPPGPRPTWWNGNVDGSAEWILSANVNDARRSMGRPALHSHGVLVDKGRWWSQEMANGRCAPNRICHSRLSERISGRVASWSLLGENVGVGSNLSSLWNAFMSSSSHRANILDSRWHYYGVGVVRVSGTYWVTMVFMRL